MGLDMYLYERKRAYVWRDEDRTAMAQAISGLRDFEGERMPDTRTLSHMTVDYEVGYWRKANHIHNWFVQNVQNGEDNCEEYPVTRQQLTDLRRVCEEVLENNDLAEELLPRSDGFFFGSQEYGEFYFQDIRSTVDIIRNLEIDYAQDRLADEDWDREFYYQSSW